MEAAIRLELPRSRRDALLYALRRIKPTRVKIKFHHDSIVVYVYADFAEIARLTDILRSKLYP